jgi:hypothetical protein
MGRPSTARGRSQSPHRRAEREWRMLVVDEAAGMQGDFASFAR